MEKSVSFLTIINIVQMLSSLAIQALIAVYLGANWQRDSLFIAMSIPLFINVILTGSVSFMLTPITAAYKSSVFTRKFYNKVLIGLLLITILLCFLLNIQSENIIKILAPGFDNQEIIFTKLLFSYSILIIPIQGVSSIINSYWVTIEKTLFPSISILLGNLFTICLIIYYGKSFSAESAANTLMLGYGLTFIITTIAYLLFIDKSIHENDYNDVSKNLKISIAPFVKQAALLLILLTFNRSASILESRFASNLDIGTISNLRYSAYIVTFLVNAVSTPVITVYYAELCRQWDNKAWNQISNFFEKGILTLTIVGAIIASISILSISELLNIFLPFTNFTAAQMILLGSYIKISMFTFILLSLSNFLGRIFYISNRFVLVAIIDVVVLVLYIVLSQILSNYFEGYGLSLAYCFYGFIVFGFYVVIAREKFNIELKKKFWIKFLSILIVSLVSFFAGFIVKYLLNLVIYPLWGTLWGIVAFFIVLITFLNRKKLLPFLPFFNRLYVNPIS